ncbi:hypothetical protein [Sagittula sp. S175]|uniref:hypothetical protein n=1 Tax=Sagittula sp. S175 TaxID=3415129 RepID=UPI003C7B99E4
MATFKLTGATLKGWTDRQLRNADLIAAGAATDTCNDMRQGAAGVSKGGSVQQGKVPVADGELIGSYGETMSPEAFRMGDTMTAGFSAPHGPRKNYGFSGTDAAGRTYNEPGWHFREQAVSNWPGNVAKNAAKFK